MAEAKTNVMRILEQKKLPCRQVTYEADPSMSGVEIAGLLGEEVSHVYKTLVTRAASGRYYVFVIPVAVELDLKAAAKAVSEKSISMLPQKELLPLTGYVHGGCSPIGMKKQFSTVVDSSALALERIFVSAGKVGHQVELSPQDLIALIGAQTAEVAAASV